MAALGESPASELLDVLTRPDADRAALIGRLQAWIERTHEARTSSAWSPTLPPVEACRDVLAVEQALADFGRRRSGRTEPRTTLLTVGAPECKSGETVLPHFGREQGVP